MPHLKNILKAILALTSVFIFLTSCHKKDSSEFIINADVRIKSFSIGKYEGQIDHKTGEITVYVPFHIDVSQIKADFQLPEGAVSNPALETTLNYSGDVKYVITNGNIYKNYIVKVKVLPPLKSFKINGINGAIDHENKTVVVMLPDGNSLKSLTPAIETEEGITVHPGTDVARDFTNPVTYQLTSGSVSVTYQVTVISNSISEYAFLGLAATRSAIADPDEKAAADWFFATYPTADYVSFQSIETGRRLSNYKIIWWHYDAAQDLPASVLNPLVVDAIRDYRINGGNLLLTTYAARYVEALGVVPKGLGPNNVFGDFGNAGFIEYDNHWGISFRTRENHPVFAGLETYEPGKAWLLEKGTFRQNHTSWWFLPEWGGYENGANWREQTGGINLASEAWDDNLNGRVGIAEWKTGDNADVIVICFGAYDWYSEPLNGGSTSNYYITNIRKITKNSIEYLINN